MKDCELTIPTATLFIIVAFLPIILPALAQVLGMALAVQKMAIGLGLVLGLIGQFLVRC